MHTTEMILFFEYNRWANARVLTVCAEIPSEQIFAPAQVSFGSLMGTLAHVYAAERSWRLRLQERVSPAKLETAADFDSLDDLRVRWQEEEQRMQSFVEGLAENDLGRWVEYTTTSGKAQGSTLWKALMHVVIHGAQFRAEAGALMSVLGHSPGDLDFIFFLRESEQR